MRTINSVIGIVNLVEDSRFLNEITEHRPLATVPFGGRYRLIDFVLSGMTNSGIADIGILAPRQTRSLLDHLRARGSGDTKDSIILLPPSLSVEEKDLFNLYSNVDFLHRSRQEFVLIANANVVGNFDYQKMIAFHRQTGADITVLCKQEELNEQECSNCILVDVQPDGRVAALRAKPAVIDGDTFFLGSFIIRKDLLLHLLDACYAEEQPSSLMEVIANNIKGLKVYAHHYDGYSARIHCMHSFFRHNMDLLKPAVWSQLFGQPRPIFTKIKDEAPSKYVGQAKVVNALIAGGCKIEGTVENSVVFRNVRVAKGARIKDSILMPNTEIGENANLEYVICDKNVRIHSGQNLQGQSTRPVILKKGTVI